MNSEARLPQIDPVTFAALNTLDLFIARAPLTRAEHAEANRSLQHLVQTIEVLQAAVKQLNGGATSPRPSPSCSPNGGEGGVATAQGGVANGGGRVAAEMAAEIFRKGVH